MSRPPPPAFRDGLDAMLAALWAFLDDGVRRGASGFHLPSLATLGLDGRPRVRTVVLRGVDPASGTVRVHCDARSAKAAELAARPDCALQAYDRAAAVQVRIEGRASLHADDAVADEAWAAARAMSRVCYGIAPGPGTPLPEGDAYGLPDEAEAVTLGRPNFAAAILRARRLELLHLDRRGHRRAAWERDGKEWTGRWLAP